jgi:hypothetical protein
MDEKTNQELTEQVERIKASIWELAQDCQGDSSALLYLLRVLEQLHWQIREKLFHPALPDTRNELYQLLRDMEEHGGWPYIERMKLQSLLINLEFSDEDASSESSSKREL